MKNASLLNEFYKYERKVVDKYGSGIKNAEEFVLSGLYSYKGVQVREEFANTIYAIVQHIKSVRNSFLS